LDNLIARSGQSAIVVPCVATTLRKGEYPARMKMCPVYYLHRFVPLRGFVTEARIVGNGADGAIDMRPR
jgi:hypothetical protein